MSNLYDPYFPAHLSPKPSSTSKLQEYKKKYKPDNSVLGSDNFRTLNSPSGPAPETYLTPSSLKLSEKFPSSNDSRSSVNALKALQGKAKTLENIIEMKDREKEIIIRNYQDLTEKIRGDLETIRSAERELRENLRHTEEEGALLRGQLERELDQMSSRFQQKSQEVQVLSMRLDEKSQFIQGSLAEFKQESAALKSSNEKLAMMNQTLSREVDDLTLKIKELEESNRSLAQRSGEFQKETYQLKASYDQAIEKYRQEFKEYQESNSEKQNVTDARIEELMDEKRTLENELKEARMNNEVLQKELDSKEIEIMRMKQKDLAMIKDQARVGSLGPERRPLPQPSLITMKEEIEIDKQDLEKNRDFSENHIKKYSSPGSARPLNETSSLPSSNTYNKTLKSIKELDREITQMNQEYQDLLMQSQNAKLSKNKEEVKQKIFYLSKMLSDATSKMYNLKMEEDPPSSVSKK